MRRQLERGSATATAIFALGAGLACAGGDTDTDVATDTDTDVLLASCPLGMSASRDAQVSLTRFQSGAILLSAGVDASIDDPGYGSSVCVGDTSARLLIYSETNLIAVLTLAGLSEGSFGLGGRVALDYTGADGSATFADDSWQSGVLTVTDTDPLTFSIANGFGVSNEGFNLTIVGQAEIVRP